MTSGRIIFHVNGSPAKNLLGTAVVATLKENQPDKEIVVVSNTPEVWLHNDDVFRVYALGKTPYFYEDYVKETDAQILALDPYLTSGNIHKNKHLIETWCELCKVKYTGLLPKLRFTQREEEVAWRLTQSDKPIFMFQPFETNPYHPGIVTSWTTDLPIRIAEAIAKEAKQKGYNTLLIRRPDQPSIENSQSINLPLRLLMASLKYSAKRLFIDSFAHQVATALNLPSVITWMNSSPETTGYSMHQNILPKLTPELQKINDSYSPLFDGGGNGARQELNTISTYDVEEILEKLKL